MRSTMTTSAGLAAALLAVAAMQLPDEALAGKRNAVRKADTKRMGNKGTFTPPNPVVPPRRMDRGNKGTFTPPSPVLPPSPVVPPSPIKR